MHPPESLRAFPPLSHGCAMRATPPARRGGPCAAALAWAAPESGHGGHVSRPARAGHAGDDLCAVHGAALAVSWWTRDGVLALCTRCPWPPRHSSALAVVELRVFRRELQPRHGVMLVSLVWLLLPLFAALPLMLAGHHLGRPLSFTHAYFEAVSGLTTTGSTVLSGLDRCRCRSTSGAPSCSGWAAWAF
jgi:hypothetical protein